MLKLVEKISLDEFEETLPSGVPGAGNVTITVDRGEVESYFKRLASTDASERDEVIEQLLAIHDGLGAGALKGQISRTLRSNGVKIPDRASLRTAIPGHPSFDF